MALLVPVFVLTLADRDSGRTVRSPYISEIVVSDRNVSYPLRNVLVFDRRPEEVFVYVSVSEMPEGARMEASVERSGRTSLISRLFGDGSLVAEEVEEDLTPLGRDSEIVSGVVKLRVGREDGGRLPAGSYTVGVRVDERLAASREFDIRGIR